MPNKRLPVTEINPDLIYHIGPQPSEEERKSPRRLMECGAYARTSHTRGWDTTTEHDYLHTCSVCLDAVSRAERVEELFIFREV